MKIRSVRIRSYKSFAETEWISLGEQFTVLVGQNSAGKSSFLQIFGPSTLSSNPHRSPLRQPRDMLVDTRIDYSLAPSGDEMKQEALRRSHIDLATTGFLAGGVAGLHFAGGHSYHLQWDNGAISAPSSPTHGLFQIDPTIVPTSSLLKYTIKD
jgi:hypothetical protein